MPGGLFGFGILNFDVPAPPARHARPPTATETQAAHDAEVGIRRLRPRGPTAIPTPAITEAPESDVVRVEVTPSTLMAAGDEPITFG